MIYFYIISPFLFITGMVLIFRRQIRSYLTRLRARLQFGTLSGAIEKADQDKSETGRKNMVVFNTASGSFEPIQKKVLKSLSQAKVQDPVRNGYRVSKARKKSKITKRKVKEVEKKSLYVTS